MLLPFHLLAVCISGLLTALLYSSPFSVIGFFILFYVLSFWILIAIFFGVMYLIGLPEDRSSHRESTSKWNRFCIVITAGVLAGIGRVRVKVLGEEKIPAGRWLLVGNHRSNFDPFVTLWALRKQELAFIMKPEIVRIPVIGKLAHAGCFLTIDRDNARNAVITIRDAVDYLRRDVTSVAIYPEGTRNKAPNETPLLPFRNGAFKIATKAQVPVVIAAIQGTEQISSRFPFRTTYVTLEICEVISAQQVTQQNTVALGGYVRDVLLNHLEKQEPSSKHRSETQ